MPDAPSQGLMKWNETRWMRWLSGNFGMKFVVGEMGETPRTTYPQPDSSSHEIHMKWPTSELSTPAVGGEGLTACATRPSSLTLFEYYKTSIWILSRLSINQSINQSIIQSQCSAIVQVFQCKLSILHSTHFSDFLFVSSDSPLIMMLFIIWHILLLRTFIPLTIPSREFFVRHFLVRSGPANLFSSSLSVPALFFLPPLFLVQLNFLVCQFYMLHLSSYPHRKCFQLFLLIPS